MCSLEKWHLKITIITIIIVKQTAFCDTDIHTCKRKQSIVHIHCKANIYLIQMDLSTFAEQFYYYSRTKKTYVNWEFLTANHSDSVANHISLKTKFRRYKLHWTTNQIKILLNNRNSIYDMWKKIANGMLCLIIRTSNRRYHWP